jgi:hypothetical protein
VPVLNLKCLQKPEQVVQAEFNANQIRLKLQAVLLQVQDFLIVCIALDSRIDDLRVVESRLFAQLSPEMSNERILNTVTVNCNGVPEEQYTKMIPFGANGIVTEAIGIKSGKVRVLPVAKIWIIDRPVFPRGSFRSGPTFIEGGIAKARSDA